MPEPLRMLGFVPRSEVGAYGPGGRSVPSLGVPGTNKAWSPISFLQTVTDFIEPQKGGVALAGKAAGGAGAAKLAALLGIGAPVHYKQFPGQIDIPLSVSNKAGEVLETVASLYHPEGSKMVEFDALGDLAGLLPTHGDRSLQSETTWSLGTKALRKLTNYINDYIPDLEFMSHRRIGGDKGSGGTKSPPSVGVDMRALREGKPVREVLLREEGNAARPLTDREKEFLNYRTFQQPDRFDQIHDLPAAMLDEDPAEVNQAAAAYLEELFGIGEK